MPSPPYLHTLSDQKLDDGKPGNETGSIPLTVCKKGPGFEANLYNFFLSKLVAVEP